MAEQGIVGRGVLLDFHSWREAQEPPIPYDAFKAGSIPLKYLKETAKAQGTEIKYGDILLIRSGLSRLLLTNSLGIMLGR
jgi:Putative cyclase